jgi:two-component sensor histidine kinase
MCGKEYIEFLSGIPMAARILTTNCRYVRFAVVLCFLFCAGCVMSLASPQEERRDPARLQSIESAIQAAGFSSGATRVVVRGIITSSRHGIVIEDRTGAIEVKPVETEHISLGDEVEVTGQLTLQPEPQVQQAEMRILWGGSMPLPLSVTPDQAADGENELFLVQTVAELVDFGPAGLTGLRLNLRGGHQNFSAVLPSDNPDEELSAKSLQPGAILRLTGILIVNHGLNTSHGDAFSLQLRTPEDIDLVEPPSWWTKAHLLLLGGIAALLVSLGFIAFNHIRHSRYRAVAEERASIARDLHDTLAQGYAGITLQLEAAQQMIDRDPERAAALLNEALQLVRHSRDESHISIDILRSLSRDDRLDMLVARCVQQLRSGCDMIIEQQVTGEASVLSYNMVNNLFRIVQEALSNAVHHARAGRIVVRVCYQQRGVLIEIEDDGKGFDPQRIPGPEEGHFGIVGMRERCAAINAIFQLESAAHGTLVRVRAEA